MLSRDAKNSATCEPIDPQLTNTGSRVWYYRCLCKNDRNTNTAITGLRKVPWAQMSDVRGVTHQPLLVSEN